MPALINGEEPPQPDADDVVETVPAKQPTPLSLHLSLRTTYLDPKEEDLIYPLNSCVGTTLPTSLPTYMELGIIYDGTGESVEIHNKHVQCACHVDGRMLWQGRFQRRPRTHVNRYNELSDDDDNNNTESSVDGEHGAHHRMPLITLNGTADTNTGLNTPLMSDATEPEIDSYPGSDSLPNELDNQSAAFDPEGEFTHIFTLTLSLELVLNPDELHGLHLQDQILKLGNTAFAIIEEEFLTQDGQSSLQREREGPVVRNQDSFGESDGYETDADADGEDHPFVVKSWDRRRLEELMDEVDDDEIPSLTDEE